MARTGRLNAGGPSKRLRVRRTLKVSRPARDGVGQHHPVKAPRLSVSMGRHVYIKKISVLKADRIHPKALCFE